MKVLEGSMRQYELVQNTKRKDLDGIIFLVAGERDLWVKILKDRSPQKEAEVRNQMMGFGFSLETPLDIVTENGRFVGYTFKGMEMDVVPSKAKSQPTAQPGRQPQPQTGSADGTAFSSFDSVTFGNNPQPQAPKGNFGLSLLTALGIGTALAVLYYFVLHGIYLDTASGIGGLEIAQGCQVVSMHGIVSILFFAIVSFYAVKEALKSSSALITVAFTMLISFVVGILIIDVLILILVIAGIMIVGTVKAVLPTIITVVIIIGVLKSFLFPGGRK